MLYVYTHNIRAEDLPDLLPVKSQWTVQGPDGSIYISNESLASREPEVPIDVAVPDDIDGSSGGNASGDNLYVAAESSKES